MVDSEGNHLGGAGTGTLRDAPVIEGALAAARRANTGATEMEMIPKVQEAMVVQEQDHRW